MGAWADLAINADTLSGRAPVDLYDPQYGDTDPARATVEYLAQAKRTIESLVNGGIPKVCRGIAAAVKAGGGTVAFFDAAAGEAELSDLLQELLASAFLWHYYGQERIGDDLYADKRQEAWETLTLQVRDFNERAPMYLTTADDPPKARPPRSYVASSTVRYDQ